MSASMLPHTWDDVRDMVRSIDINYRTSHDTEIPDLIICTTYRMISLLSSYGMVPPDLVAGTDRNTIIMEWRRPRIRKFTSIEIVGLDRGELFIQDEAGVSIVSEMKI